MNEQVPLGWERTLTVACVLAGQGIHPHQAAGRLTPLEAAAVRALGCGVPLLEPRVAARVHNVTRVTAAGVELTAGLAIDSPIVANHVAEAEQMVVVVCTVGARIDRLAASLIETDPLLAMALDGLACSAVEMLAAAVWREARDRAATLGLRITAPIAPGDAWPLAEGQLALFAAVDAARAGISLGESGQMRPVKSVSFVAGVGRSVVAGEATTCVGCGARDRCRWKEAREGMRGGH